MEARPIAAAKGSPATAAPERPFRIVINITRAGIIRTTRHEHLSPAAATGMSVLGLLLATGGLGAATIVNQAGVVKTSMASRSRTDRFAPFAYSRL